MFAKRKKLITFMLTFATMIFIGCASLTGCSESDNKTIEQSSPDEQSGSESNIQTGSGEVNNDNGVKHYEIALNMQNFNEFLEYKYTYSSLGIRPDVPNSKGHSYFVTGVLSFAYYQNVVVTFRMTRTDTNQYRDFQVKLNAAGAGGFYQADQIYKESTSILGSSDVTVSIKNVTGMVIFDI